MPLHRQLLSRGFKTEDVLFAHPADVDGFEPSDSVGDKYGFITNCIRVINQERENGNDCEWKVVFGFFVERCSHGHTHQTFRFGAVVKTGEDTFIDPNLSKKDKAREFIWDRQITWRAFSFADLNQNEKEIWMPPVGRCTTCITHALHRAQKICEEPNGGILRYEILHLFENHPTYHDVKTLREFRLELRAIVNRLVSQEYFLRMFFDEWHFAGNCVLVLWNQIMPEGQKINYI